MSAAPPAPAPVVRQLHVPIPAAEAFALFTQDMARWWPLQSHSCSLDRDSTLEFDGRIGGELVERTAAGRSYFWGRVLVWEPPHRFAMTWHPGQDPDHATRLEVRFDPDGDGCRLLLTHDGWDARGPSAATVRDQYDQGWIAVIGCFDALTSRRR